MPTKRYVIWNIQVISYQCDPCQKWKGLFRSPFILQTFAAHLGAIDGSVKILGLHGPDKPIPVMAGGLGLAAASVRTEHYLQGPHLFWLGLLTGGKGTDSGCQLATGTLTIEMAHASKGKTIPLPRTVNRSTGKESMRQTGFSDIAWGKATRSYAISAQSLANTKFDAIVKKRPKNS